MLSGNKIMLRALEPSDIDLLYQWENDTSIWKMSNTIEPFSRHVLEKYIADAHLGIYTTKQLRLMITRNSNSPSSPGVSKHIHSTSLPIEKDRSDPHCKPGGEAAIGCIDLFDFDPNNQKAGVGILIADTSERRKGYASEALELLINYAFTTLNLHQLYCNVPVDNKASIKLFKNKGFKETGIKKDWIKTNTGWNDEYILQLVNL